MGNKLLNKDGKNFFDHIEKWVDDYMAQDSGGYPPVSLSDMTVLTDVDSTTVAEMKDYLMMFNGSVDTDRGNHQIAIFSKDRFKVKMWTGTEWFTMYAGLAGSYIFGANPVKPPGEPAELFPIADVANVMAKGEQAPPSAYINSIDITTVPIGDHSLEQPRGAYFDASDYYEITNEAEFLAMNEKGCYKLMNDITITDQSSFFILNFSGIIEGNGHILTINQTNLFDKIERATFRNMKLVLNTDINDSGGSNAGLANTLINTHFYDMEIELNVTTLYANSYLNGVAIQQGGKEVLDMMGGTITLPSRNWFEKCKFVTNVETSSIEDIGIISRQTNPYVVNIIDCKWEGNVNYTGASNLVISMLGITNYNNATQYFANNTSGGGVS